MTTTEMSSSAALLIPLLLVFSIQSYGSSSSKAKDAPNCSRSCGIHNISHPFRLKDSPHNCGDLRYSLSCENNQLALYWKSGKYYVRSINYNNYTIRLVDANIGLHDYSSLPRYSLATYNFSNQDNPSEPYEDYQFSYPSSIFYNLKRLTKPMIYLRCPYPVHSSDGTATCMNSLYGLGSVFYVNVDNKSLWDLGLEDSCRIELMYLTSWPAEYNHSNISCRDIHNMLLYGFELSWLEFLLSCYVHCLPR